MNQTMTAGGWRAAGWLGLVGTIIFLLIAAPLVWGGIELIAVGGSAYYLIVGIALALVALLILRGHRVALWLYVVVLAGTIAWALAEVGLSCWDLMPRILAPAILGLWFAIPAVRRRLVSGPVWPGAAWATPLLFVIAFALMFGSYAQARFVPVDGARKLTPVSGDPTQWLAFGNDQGGSRFTTASLITPANAGQLEPAWTYRTGEVPPPISAKGSMEFESVPLAIDGHLIICTQNNTVISVDADTGKEVWRTKPPIDFSGSAVRRCRGVSYAKVADQGPCAERVIEGTLDDQLVALDVKTGQLCPDFGKNGMVSLKAGLGRNPNGFAFVSSPPAIVRGVAVVGSFVFDNQTTDAVPGVIRAYDVKTGELRWAWSVMSPNASPPLKDGEGYPRAGPNMWTAPSADEALGLVFLPTGNPSPDYWGGLRKPEQDKYGSSIVAVDVATGNVRWAFKTTYHDVWDYDVGSQPVLADLPTSQGLVPAVLAPTKRGEIFVLDRRTGKPLTGIENRPVPQGPAPGDWLAPTQPFVTGFPSFRPKVMTETAMWGATPIDQMLCRIAFHTLRYEGLFTPGSEKGAIHDPGANGVFNWGSLAVDKARRIAIVNTSWMPFVDTLIPRKSANAAGMHAYGEPAPAASGPPVRKYSEFSFPFPQMHTPYAVDTSPFLSPLGIPCKRPPWGAIAAIDLDTKKVLWQQPFGNTRNAAPLGLALPVGVFSHGGASTTASGVTFIAATIDSTIRAYETATGRLLWQANLPAGGQSTPISFVSKRTGRQYVVMTAGGNSTMNTPKGDYMVAFALPVSK
jgi:quinoprotein glucose dehydrogenase/quinate dehydrogenase (quinone)